MRGMPVLALWESVHQIANTITPYHGSFVIQNIRIKWVFRILSDWRNYFLKFCSEGEEDDDVGYIRYLGSQKCYFVTLRRTTLVLYPPFASLQRVIMEPLHIVAPHQSTTWTFTFLSSPSGELHGPLLYIPSPPCRVLHRLLLYRAKLNRLQAYSPMELTLILGFYCWADESLSARALCFSFFFSLSKCGVERAKRSLMSSANLD